MKYEVTVDMESFLSAVPEDLKHDMIGSTIHHSCKWKKGSGTLKWILQKLNHCTKEPFEVGLKAYFFYMNPSKL